MSHDFEVGTNVSCESTVSPLYRANFSCLVVINTQFSFCCLYALRVCINEPVVIVLVRLSDNRCRDLFVLCFSFNRIDIPPYETYEKFLEKLTCAVEETCGFTVE